MLIVFGGLPGTGKTTLCRALALRLAAVHLRIDTIEQAILNSSIAPASVEEAGYLVGYSLAEDNLRLGRNVIADSVNPLRVTRDAWLRIAKQASARAIEIEVICSDGAEHRRRIETRRPDIAGHKLPSWQEVVAREYHPWDSPSAVIDTARESLEESLAKVCAVLDGGQQ